MSYPNTTYRTTKADKETETQSGMGSCDNGVCATNNDFVTALRTGRKVALANSATTDEGKVA